MIPVVVVHGGAGDVAVDRRAEQMAGCRKAAEAGLATLAAGKSALDAVECAVRVLEDDPRFNAGHGACLTAAGTIELDASIVDGAGMRVGAVCALPPFANPIGIARAVMEHCPHILLAGEAAAAFARAHGFSPATADQLVTDAARQRLARHLATRDDGNWAGGTVGAVAIDPNGNVAAATSTGGTVGKLPGRVGDTPIVGAGCDADNSAGACSCTGRGEAVMRACLGRMAIECMRSGATAEQAAAQALARFRSHYGGRGGLILVDRSGGIGCAFNSQTMAHAVARAGSETACGC